ncbi:hypothetical protein RB195_025085 [Necator americanus]|uniref:Uncharacterized protein n=1 Tax=Necator americanus TaxID=51031 RepID=A0ABR1ESZ4_NECAM
MSTGGRFIRCSGLILSGPGAVRFLTSHIIACRISDGRISGVTCPSSLRWSSFIATLQSLASSDWNGRITEEWKNYWRPLDQFEDQRESSGFDHRLYRAETRPSHTMGKNMCYQQRMRKEVYDDCEDSLRQGDWHIEEDTEV